MNFEQKHNNNNGSKSLLINPSFALVGFSLTGKDSLIKDLQSKQISLGVNENENDDVKWIVYGNAEIPELNGYLDLETIFDHDNSHSIKRYAFADALKVETHNDLGLINCPANAFENVKNTMLLPDVKNPGCYKTIRKFYIDYGQMRRADDPLVWVKKVNEKIENEKFALYNVPMEQGFKGWIDVISDFRFDNELMDRFYSNGSFQSKHQITTIRLHRASVPVTAKLADRTIDSEHNLDGLVTKYLFIPPGLAELYLALERFPQYKNYKPIFFVLQNKKK